MNTKGLETLVLLEHLDLSENLIELYVVPRSVLERA